MAHGLSGTYTSALAAAQLCDHADHICVVNTRTLCGPHRYMVEKCVSWAKDGMSRSEILEKLNALINSAKSYLVPVDFDYLRRGGRLSPLVSYMGKAANLTPIMTQTETGERLTPAGIRRGYSHAVKYIVAELQKAGIGKGWRVYISHAGVLEKAQMTMKALQNAMPDAYYEILPLSPAFITQGGPACVAVQYVKE